MTIPSERLAHRNPFRLAGRMNQRLLGRFLQGLGLLILPFSIASQLVNKVGLAQSMLISAGGALVFYMGYVLQHRTNV